MKRIIFVYILLTSLIYSYNQNDPDGKIVLSLDDALNVALENNKDILIAKEDLFKSDAQISEAYGNALPQVNLSAGYTRYLELPVMFIPPNTPFNQSGKVMKFSMGADNSYSASLTASQVLFSFKVNTAIKIAKEYSNYSKFNAESTREEVILSVKKAYYGILLAQKVVEVSQQSYDLAKANYENVQKLHSQGVAAEFDLLRAEVQVANTEPVLSQAENGLQLAMNGLKNLLSIDLNKEIEVSGTLELAEVAADVVNTESDLAVERNSNVKGLLSLETIYDKNITIQQADYFPTLAAFGTYAYQTQDNTFKFRDYNWANNFMVGLQITYPIFNGLQTKYRSQQAFIEKEKIRLNRLKLEDGIKIQVETSRLKMLEAKKRYNAQLKSVQQAEKAVSIADIRFKSGVGTQIELIDSQVALTRTRMNQAQAVYDYLMARSEWEKAAGFSTQQ